jgi:ATP-binding cassette subfamily B protein
MTVNKPMRRLFKFISNYKSPLVLASSSSILNKIVDLMPPFLTAWLIDSINKQPPVWLSKYFPESTIWQQVIIICVALLIAFFLEGVTEWIFKRNFMQLAQRVQHDLRNKAYSKLQKKKLSFFESARTGNLLAILNDDINQLERFLNNSFNEILQIVTLFIFAGYSLFERDVVLGLVGISPIPFIIFGSFYYQRKISPFYKEVRESVGGLSSRLENNISGILVIKSFGTEKYEEKRVDESSQEYLDANYKAIKLSALYVPIIRMFIALGLAATLALGAYWVIYQPGRFSLGGIAFFAMMIQRILWPVTRLGNIFDEFERAKASARRVFGLLENEKDVQADTGIHHSDKIDGALNLQNVDFAYSNGIPILKDISLNIPAGSTLGIMGVTGAGKTTFIKILLRLYEVNGGSITLDGVNIKDWKIESLRKAFSLVSQEVYLFHGTIMENLLYGNNASREEAIQAAKQVDLHNFIEQLPNQYDSIVGERGIKLSGGQKQRISIARAILKDSPILILDEATSAVDSRTEQIIQEQIRQLSQKKTSIIIAHRLSTIQNADQIIMLQHGDIKEQGTHETLMELDGNYAKMFRMQSR